MTKLIDNALSCFWYAMGGVVFLSFWFLVISVLIGVTMGINESALKYQDAAQVERDKADEFRQAQLEWYRSQTDKETP